MTYLKNFKYPCTCIVGLSHRLISISQVTYNPKPLAKHQFLNGTSSAYIEDMYRAWSKDPSSVHASWDSYFRNATHGVSAYEAPPSLASPRKNEMPLSAVQTGTKTTPTRAATSTTSDKSIADHLKVQAIIRSYQVRGHLVANLDPLGIKDSLLGRRNGTPPKEILKELDFGKEDYKRVFQLPSTTHIGGNDKSLPLQEILNRLESAYCGNIGAEYMFIEKTEPCDWLRKKLEPPGSMNVTKEEKKLILNRLCRTHSLEAFLAKKWASEKRFGIEGCEMAIPCLLAIIDKGSELGVESFIIGMAHRGRLNVLANVCHKPLYQIFTQFSALKPTDDGSGDVKYHLGTVVERLNSVTKKKVKVTVVANPSHLEAVNPVIQGMAKAEQFYGGDAHGKKTVTIAIHGDAAFCGQGVVFETINLSELPEYTTYGTIHIVINNQIGFTTDPRYSRSSQYCTDVGKVVNAPIFHANSDDPESVVFVSKIAAEYRSHFGKDVVVDVVGYRRNGHNEMDEPMFTQPLMYTRINQIKPIFLKYADQLIKENVVTAEDVKKLVDDYAKFCEAEFQKAQKETHMKFNDWLDSPWHGFFKGKDPLKCAATGVKEDVLQHIGKQFSSPPPKEFVIHRGLDRILKGRMKMVQARVTDWALGEAMAIGSLLKEGIHVRISGQDVERGTFSHRHHILHHQTADKATYKILNDLYPKQAPYSVCNSSLSENSVLGFEIGYANFNPNALIIWEAQFGDFANTAQCIIDTFLSSGQSKWVRQTGLVMLLPHALEGQGPEHSSARIERYLQLSNDDSDHFPKELNNFETKQLKDINWICVNCSTPANLFHVLRRQIKLPFRKPLIVFTPKILLRHPEARSSFDDYLENTQFMRVISEAGPASKNPSKVKKLIFCSGKAYYDFKKLRESKKLTDVMALTRIEQFSPFPFDLVKSECSKYPSAKYFWGQEEHKNSGAWTYFEPRFRTALEGKSVGYIGRGASAAPSTGSKVQHINEEKQLANDVLKID